MKRLKIADVRKRLPSIIEDVAHSNESVVVTRYGKPMASIVPFRAKTTRQTRYPLRGHPVTVADDFDAPMPELWHALTAQEEEGQYASARRRGLRASIVGAAKRVRNRSSTVRR